jgi:hypothetical protein
MCALDLDKSGCAPIWPPHTGQSSQLPLDANGRNDHFLSVVGTVESGRIGFRAVYEFSNIPISMVKRFQLKRHLISDV